MQRIFCACQIDRKVVFPIFVKVSASVFKFYPSKYSVSLILVKAQNRRKLFKIATKLGKVMGETQIR